MATDGEQATPIGSLQGSQQLKEWTMTSKPPNDASSQASPGQTEKRDQLIRIYDELDDAGKQELLRLAMELFGRR